MTSSNDIYVMPAFVTLAVRDLSFSTRWYQEVLGFLTLFEVPGQLVHLRREKYQDILLKPAEDKTLLDGPHESGISVCFTIGKPLDIQRLAARAMQQKAEILEGPIDRPWNVRELVLSDPDGYRLILSGGPVAERRMEELFPDRE